MRCLMICGLLGSLILLAGCFGRQHIVALSNEQQAYFDRLDATLQSNRQLLEISLEDQLKADLARRRQMLEWERDLVKIDVLIDKGENVKGRQTLLFMKMAELDLASLDRLEALQSIDHSRVTAVLKLYDSVIQAIQALRENNRVIGDYLAGKDFALTSLDVAAIVRVVSAIRQVEEDVKGLEDKAVEKRRKEEERLEKTLDRVRDVIIKGFNR